MSEPFSLSTALLAWFDRAGRKNLPWQRDISPYRVWISEIMLQQTQVATVIPYFEAFVSRFPDVKTLSSSSVDDVLAHWTGLGYYSRARNLHRAAQWIVEKHGGEVPNSLDRLCELPGIGRSTAAAIASIAYSKPAAILDGNVKRVLSRFHAVPGWPGISDVEKALWRHAEEHTPTKRPGDYTQAIMDLGATICTRSAPQCEACPLCQHCQALAQKKLSQYPGKKPARTLPVKAVQMLMIRNPKNELLLRQRPPKGLWGGLWCLPEIPPEMDPVTHCAELCGHAPIHSTPWPSWQHSFSHYHLHITPVLLELPTHPTGTLDSGWLWSHPDQAGSLGMPAPLVRLMAQCGPRMN